MVCNSRRNVSRRNIATLEEEAKRLIQDMDTRIAHFLTQGMVLEIRNRALDACYQVVCAEAEAIFSAHAKNRDRRLRHPFQPKLRELFAGTERARADITKFAVVLKTAHDEHIPERRFRTWLDENGGIEAIYTKSRSAPDKLLRVAQREEWTDNVKSLLETGPSLDLPDVPWIAANADGDYLAVVRVHDGRGALLHVLNEITEQQVYRIVRRHA